MDAAVRRAYCAFLAGHRSVGDGTPSKKEGHHWGAFFSFRVPSVLGRVDNTEALPLR
jgi:hypothetical protein